MQDSDAKLVQRCTKGDPHAWESLVRNYSGKLLNMAYRYLGSYPVAEEVTQDVFVKIYQNLGNFNPRSGSFQNWVMRVGRNLIIDYYRAHKREKSVAGSDELEALDFGPNHQQPTPFENVDRQEQIALVRRGLSRLSLELREAVILRDLQGYSYQEIAELLQIPEGTVKSRINRGRIELARVLRCLREEARG
ncbi:MAG TPA: sigma-70 family RNA polymerase sigma factor [Acidobacteriota bacterium]|nr:sigma-70 family RNA polymerase sigma factor [Acidobacteriota bacterium]HRR56245.1 sigma-70 family RNA polymerase sigma factor [Acidobacteriota bacterium]HRV08225.1 sigma-70 family RNA polymerase sigma factor [Acidobacteriota bacterium]